MKNVFTFLIFILTTTSLNAQEVAFTLSEKDLIPEGITADPATGDFYISSIYKYKIVRFSKGKATDFIPSYQDGFLGGVGLHVDSRRNILWACTGNILGPNFRRGIFAYDITSGKLLNKITYPLDTAKRFFNDLVIDKDGIVYITDTFDHSIWKWGLSMESPQNIELAPVKLALDGKVEYPNGITISPDDRFLFVATDAGLKRVNLNNNAVELIPMPAGSITSRGLDGIEFYNNSIIAVQNGYEKNSDMKVIRYYLTNEYDKIERAEVIDTGNKFFDVPTTFTIMNGELYLIANSQISNLDQLDPKQLNIKQPDKLKEPVVLKYKLK